MRFSICSLALVLAFSVGLNSCTKKNDDGDLQVLNLRQRDPIKSWDPVNAYDTISLEGVYMIFEPLYQYDIYNEEYKVVPLVAADMPKFSADRLTVTIPLRKDVKFADDPCFKATGGKGRGLTAKDFIFAIKRMADPTIESNGFWIFDGKLEGFNAFQESLKKISDRAARRKAILEGSISGLTAPDDYTLQLKLIKPYPQLLYTLAMAFTAPVAQEAEEAYADEKGNLTDKPVGTGPFVLKLWDRERRIELVRNTNYHTDFMPTAGAAKFKDTEHMADAGKPLPFLDKINIDMIKEAQPAWLKFMKQESDIATIDKDNFSQAITNRTQLTKEFADKGVKLQIDSGATFFYLQFNMKDKVVGGNNKFLRQAISSAIDRNKWIEIFLNGRGEKMINGLPPGIQDRPKTAAIKYDLDLAKAKELLKKAGFPDGKGLPELKLDMRGSSSTDRQLGEFLTQQVGQIGVKLDVIYNTFPAYLEKARKANLQVALGGWGLDYPDAENAYQLLYSKNVSPGPNEANYANPEFDKMFEQIQTIESGPKRAELVQKLDDIMQEDAPWAPGYYRSTYYVAQPWVKNFRYSDIIQNLYKYIRIDKDLKKKLRK